MLAYNFCRLLLLEMIQKKSVSFSTTKKNKIRKSILVMQLSQLVAIDVIFKHGLLHGVADHRAERTHSVTLLVLLQLLLRDAGEALLAVTAHHHLLPTGDRNKVS